MHIVVLIKQVVATTNVKLDPETGTMIRDGVESILNPFDEYAVEEALRIKERMGQGKVTVVTMGPPQAKEIIRKAVGMGVDEGILVSDRLLAGSDTWATAYTLSQVLKKIGDFRMIITGKQAVDGDTAQVGPEIAACLDLPMIAWVRKIESISETQIRAERLMEDGFDVLESPLPAIISVVKEINEPRLESLKGKMRAKKYDPQVLTVADLPGFEVSQVGLKGSPTKVFKTFTPQRQYKGEMIAGEPAQAAANLYEKIKTLKIV
ncbi:electron transfer flavoprotein subunit beta/FixA family protein [candidate division FCPU426 bacterium]|nr:electron transfer flavoprotein subunit beta/FixA family protein [candidate division FCPU426 bacterium]